MKLNSGFSPNFVKTPEKKTLWGNQEVQQINGTYYLPGFADNVM
jgi:hypothetical protein